MQLENLGLIGNCQGSALVDTSGEIVWCCLPRFDSEPLLSTLLDIEDGGRFRICPDGAEKGNPLERFAVRRYLTNMKTTVSSKGQIVLPSELRRQDNIEAGQKFQVERLDRGEYRIVRQTEPPNAGLVDWLLACPEKDYFISIHSESTDTL